MLQIEDQRKRYPMIPILCPGLVLRVIISLGRREEAAIKLGDQERSYQRKTKTENGEKRNVTELIRTRGQ
jgi:hypothetical protein